MIIRMDSSAPTNPPPIASTKRHTTIAQFRTARDFAMFSLIPFVIASIGGLFGRGVGTAMTIIGCVIGGFLLLIAMMIFGLAARWQTQVDEMLAGNFYVHWTYEPAQWRAYIAEQKRKTRRLWLILGALFTLCGLLIAGFLHEDREHIAGLPVLTWTICPLVGFFVGAIPGWIIQKCMNAGFNRMAASQGEIYIGPRGFFLSGSYSPWNTAGQTLREVKHVVGPPDALLITAEVFNGQTTVPKEFSIPVPLGREAEVAELIRKFGA